jgi:hypothetical protein
MERRQRLRLLWQLAFLWQMGLLWQMRLRGTWGCCGRWGSRDAAASGAIAARLGFVVAVAADVQPEVAGKREQAPQDRPV